MPPTKILLPLVLLVLSNHANHAINHEQRLVKQLLNSYTTNYSRPLLNPHRRVHVLIGLRLTQITDFDDRHQILTSNIWQTYQWTDEYLRWDPSDYDGIESVGIPNEPIWKPDIVLLNYADTRIEDKRNVKCKVYSNGVVIWKPMSMLKSTCRMNTRYFPYDRQQCEMSFGSRTYSLERLAIDLLPRDAFTVEQYMPSSTFILSDWSAQIVEKSANDEFTAKNETFAVAVFRIIISRQHMRYAYILVLPCILLSILSSLIYWLPPESPSKPNLGMSLFTSFFLLLLLLYGKMPPSSQTFPLIGIYYCINMCSIAASTIMCAVVVHIYQRGTGELPIWLKRHFLEYMAQVLMVGRVRPVQSTRRIMPRERSSSSLASSPVWTRKTVRPASQSPRKQPAQNTSFLKSSLREIIAYVRRARARDCQSEDNSRRTEDWRRLALVADRIFFIIYVLVTCLITTLLFFQ